MTDEDMQKLSKLLREVLISTANEGDEQAQAEARTDARLKMQLAATDKRFEQKLAFRKATVADQLRSEAAATILAALIGNHVSPLTDVAGLTASAVAFADALRAELGKGAP